MPIDWDGGTGTADGMGAAGAGIGAVVPTMNVDAMKSVEAETGKLIAAAKSGGFRISADGVKPLRTALRNMQDRLDKLSQKTVLALSQSPKLGGHEYGQTVAQHDLKGATGQAGSAVVVLDQLQQVLTDADEALQRAAGIYKESEESAKNSVPGA